MKVIIDEELNKMNPDKVEEFISEYIEYYDRDLNEYMIWDYQEGELDYYFK